MSNSMVGSRGQLVRCSFRDSPDLALNVEDECRMGGLFTEHVVGEHKNALRQREEHRRVGANAPQWQYISFLKER